MDIMYPAGRVRLGRPPAPDGDRRADEVGDRRDALRGHRRRDRERDRRQRRRGPDARSRSSPRTGRRSGTRSATPTPASSATTWPPTSASPGWTTRSSSTTRSRRRPGTSTSRRTTSTPAAGSSRRRWPTRCSRRRSSTTATSRSTRSAAPASWSTPTRSPTRDENGPGTLPGPDGDGIGADGQPVEQRPYEVTNQNWFRDENRLMPHAVPRAARRPTSRPTRRRSTSSTRSCSPTSRRRRTRRAARTTRRRTTRTSKAWVERGGNLVLTDKALHALGDLGVVPADAITGHQRLPAVRELPGLRPSDDGGPAAQRAPAGRGGDRSATGSATTRRR